MRKLLSYICLLALLLSGCGARDKAPEPGEEGPGAWSSEFTKLGEIDTAGATCAFDGGFYLSGGVEGETTLWHCDAVSGKFRQLTDYTPSAPMEGCDESRVSLLALCPSPDGGLLAVENAVGSKDGEWLFESRLRILDGDGAELGAIDLTAADSAAMAAMDAGVGASYSRNITDIGAGPDGEVLLVYGGSLLVLVDAAGQLLFCEEADTFIPAPIKLADGSCGFLANGIGGVVLRVFNCERREFLDDILLPAGNQQFFPGGGDFDLSYISASCVYGLELGSGEGVQLASLVNCGVNQDRLLDMYTGSDGSVNCLLRDPDGGVELARLELSTERRGCCAICMRS